MGFFLVLLFSETSRGKERDEAGEWGGETWGNPWLKKAFSEKLPRKKWGNVSKAKRGG